VVRLIGARFVRSEPRARVGVYLRGLLAGLERKNGWTLAEHAGVIGGVPPQRATSARSAGCWTCPATASRLRRRPVRVGNSSAAQGACASS
jgi:hypothetical protein